MHVYRNNTLQLKGSEAYWANPKSNTGNSLNQTKMQISADLVTNFSKLGGVNSIFVG